MNVSYLRPIFCKGINNLKHTNLSKLYVKSLYKVRVELPHSFSYAVSMNLEHSIKEGSHERYPDHFQCFRNIKKIKYPGFQAMTYSPAKMALCPH